jgi:hypothetical protein
MYHTTYTKHIYYIYLNSDGGTVKIITELITSDFADEIPQIRFNVEETGMYAYIYIYVYTYRFTFVYISLCINV